MAPTSTTGLDQLARSAREEFERRFGRPPRWVVAAPGRVNLIGEHTDYNDGFVLPMAIHRHVVIAADHSEASDEAHLYSVALGQWSKVAVAGPIAPRPLGWASYVQGVIAGFLTAGTTFRPFEALFHSDLPLGGGLSSSAALEVATATLLEAMTGRQLEPLEKALLCQKAEHDFAGVPCGVMDQIASIQGRAGMLLLLDCRSRAVRLTPLADPNVVALIVNTNVRHSLSEGEYAARRQQCGQAARVLGVSSLRDADLSMLERRRGQMGDLLYRRARHVVTENARTVQAAEAVRRADWETMGRLMHESHVSLRDDYEVSCAELDLMVELAASLGKGGGVLGARMTGGGFGGCAVLLVRRGALDYVSRQLHEGYQRSAGRSATLFVTEPADGARVLLRPANESQKGPRT